MRCDLKRNYDGAKALCEQDNARLVTIASQEEQDLVKSLPGYETKNTLISAIKTVGFRETKENFSE